MSAKLMEYFNKQPRIGSLSTATKNGKVNAACFGSPQMVDEKTVIMAVRKNRTLANLQENPNAIFMIMEPGKTGREWKGVRVYLKMTDCQTSGEKMDMMRKAIAKLFGENEAKTFYATITFDIQDVRPLYDMGQGWEKSI